MPETRGGVNGDGGQLAGELGVIDSTKEVATLGVVCQINREDRSGKLWHNSVKEGSLLGGLDSVELGKSKTAYNTGGAGAVTVGDLPAGSLHQLEGGALGWVKDGVLANGGL